MLCAICIIHVSAQENIEFDNIVNQDGSQLGHVFDIIEDQEGFIWFCTGNGLVKYDGYSTDYYVNDSKDTTSLSNSWIYSGLCDSQGRIWIGTENGLNRMDRKTEKFTRYMHQLEDSFTISSPMVRDLFEDSKGRIWIGTFKGLDLYDEEKNCFKRIQFDDFAGQRLSSNICEDANGKIYITGLGGLYEVNEEEMKAVEILQDRIPGSDIFACKSCMDDGYGNLWITGFYGLKIFNYSSGEVRNPDLPAKFLDENINALVEYPEGKFSIAMGDKGLLVCDIKDQKFERQYYRDPNDTEGISVNSVYSLHQDRNQNLWLGLFHGVNKFALNTNEPILLRNVRSKTDLNNYTLRVYGDPFGGIWTNTMYGVYHRASLNDPSQKIVCPPIIKSDGASIQSFHMDSERRLWFTINRLGLFYYLPDENRVVSIRASSQQDYGISNIRMIADRRNESIKWVASRIGLFYYNHDTKTHKWFYPSKDIPSLENDAIGMITQDRKGNLWMTKAGLIKFDTQNEKFDLFDDIYESEEINTSITGLMSHDSDIWFTTRNSLNRYNSSTGNFENYTHKDGLEAAPITSSQVDKNGFFWFAQNGITRYDVKKRKSQSYRNTQNSGGIIRGFSGITEEGHILFPTTKGVLLINPEKIEIDKIAPKVVIREIRLDDRNIEMEVIPEYIEFFRVKPNQKVITFEYAGLKYDDNDAINFRVKLEHFDEDWRDVGHQREVTYTNLKPGHYSFYIKAANRDGVWSDYSKKIDFEVLPPYWKTAWFKVLIALIAFFVLYGISKYYLYTENLRKEKRIAEQNANYKSMFLANMSHEIRTPMNAVLGMSQLLSDTAIDSKQREYLNIIQESTKNLLVIINDILDQSKIESGKYTIREKPFEIRLLLGQLKRIFEIRCREKDLDYQINLDSKIPQWLNGDVSRINQILMNLVGNAIKFTDQGKVSLDVSLVECKDEIAKINFSVIDSGRGIADEKKTRIFESFERISDPENFTSGTGLGLAISKQLVEQMQGEIWVESKLNRGSNFTFSLNLKILNPHSEKSESEQEPFEFPSGINFLVAEDTLFNQKLAEALLNKYFKDAAIDIAANGRIALEMSRNSNYDIILMDIKMPGMDGYEASEAIRQERGNPNRNTPIIAVTANAIPEQLEKCIKRGMNSWITKPINGEELINVIKKYVVDSKQQERNNNLNISE